MCSIILILQLGFFLLTSSDGFTDPSVPDLNCTNDYETEMKCNLTVSELGVCSEYKLNVSIKRIKEGLYECSFEKSHSNTCQCTLKAQFNIGEIFEVNVSRDGNILDTKEISIGDTIKPKQPIIISVHRSELGNFIIKLNTSYSKDVPKSFLDSLIPELSYGIEGSTYDPKVKELGIGQTTDELVGSYLEPNSNYVLRVRVKSKYSEKSYYSDYSEPYHFTTSSPSQNVLIIISLILCVITIICISSIYYWYNKVLKVWWVKIPTPKVATHFVKQVEQLLSFQTEFSPVCIEPSLDHIGEKTRTAPSEDTNSQPGLEECDALPAEVLYAQTGYESVQETQCVLSEEHPSRNTSATDYGNLEANSGSSFCNKLYLSSGPNCSCISEEVTHQTAWFNQKEKDLQTLDPIIPTDFDYGTCNAFVSTGPVLFSELVLVPGYQSVDEIADHDCKGLTMEKLNCSEKQNDISLYKLNPIPVVDGYQDFQSVS